MKNWINIPFMKSNKIFIQTTGQKYWEHPSNYPNSTRTNKTIFKLLKEMELKWKLGPRSINNFSGYSNINRIHCSNFWTVRRWNWPIKNWEIVDCDCLFIFKLFVFLMKGGDKIKRTGINWDKIKEVSQSLPISKI